MVTVEQVNKLKELYQFNKEELEKLANEIKLYGVTDSGLTDVTESFEQGYNNALEQVFDVLGIKPITVEELKSYADYEFECNMSEGYKDSQIDEWGCAEVWFKDIGVEYNFCIDGETNSCAIYKTEIDPEEFHYVVTDYDTYIHYEIDFDNENWKEELENAMCEALIEFHNL